MHNRDKRQYLLPVFLLLVILVMAGQVRFRMIDDALPYLGHEDERGISYFACDILKTGNFNTRFFHYPSLPVYLAAGGMVLGFAGEAGRMLLNHPKQIGSCSFPYFDRPGVVRPAKQMFALFSLVAMAAFGWLGMVLTGQRSMLFLVPGIIFLSENYLHYSHQYLNVDIVGTMFVALLYLALVYHRDSPSLFDRAILPGILSGMAIASKYNLGIVLVPVLLTLLLYEPRQLGRRISAYMASMLGTFLVCVPYALVEFEIFLEHVGFEIFYYKKGRLPGYDNEPGWDQLSNYLGHLTGDYTFLVVILFLVGVAVALRRNWKLTTILLSFPLIFLLYMGSNRGWAVRNIVSLYLFYGLFAGVGFHAMGQWLWQRLVPRVTARYGPLTGRGVAGLVIVVLFVVVFPVHKVDDWYHSLPDTRKQGVSWVNGNVPAGRTLLVPVDLEMRTSALADRYRLVSYNPSRLGLEASQGLLERYPDAVVITPHYGIDIHVADTSEQAAQLNRLASDYEVLVEFPGKPVNLSYTNMVPRGNPSFSIRQRPTRQTEQQD